MKLKYFFLLLSLCTFSSKILAQTQQLTPVDSFSAADVGKYPEPNTFILADKEPAAINLDEFKSALVLPQNLPAEKPTKVLLRVLVDTGGSVVRYSFLKRENKEVEEAVLAKLSVLRYSAAIKDSKPIVDWATLLLKFKSQIVPLDTSNKPDPFAFVPVQSNPEAIEMKKFRDNVQFPPLLKAVGMNGKVTLRILVSKEGKYVKHIVLSSTHPAFTKALEQHINELTFKPAIQGNMPVTAWVTIPFLFTLPTSK